jgi:hypothetical protein
MKRVSQSEARRKRYILMDISMSTPLRPIGRGALDRQDRCIVLANGVN